MQKWKPCSTCPFAGKSEKEKCKAQEPGSTPPYIMLCHEAIEVQESKVCVGFYDDLPASSIQLLQDQL